MQGSISFWYLYNYSSEIRNPNFTENLLMCAKVGISQPTADLVANATPLTGIEVTPAFISRHVETLHIGETIGLAIRRIIGGEQPRDFKPNSPIEEKPIKEYVRYSIGLSGVAE